MQRIIIHWTGCGYYYATEAGQQLSKRYKTIGKLRKYGKLWDLQ
jgi:hypothetical protein